MRSSHDTRRTRQRGIALIEALVGILIFAFGVLGLLGLQASMTKAQGSSKLRADAADLASEVLALIQTDASVNITHYTDANCAANAVCADWKRKVNLALPNAQTSIGISGTAPGPFVITVNVSWQRSNESRNQYQTSMQWNP